MNTPLKRLLAGFGALFVVYGLFFTDWIKPAPIEVTTSYRSNLPRKFASFIPPGTLPVAFAFDGLYRLSHLAVYDADNPAGGKPVPLWRMKGTSFWKGVPTRGAMYGMPLAGMTNLISPAPLVPGKKYRLVVESGRHRGETVFDARAIPEGMDISPDPALQRDRSGRRNRDTNHPPARMSGGAPASK